MKKLFIGFFLIACLFVAGCNSGAKWDKAEMEQGILKKYNDRAIAAKLPLRCNKVSLVADGDNKFTGFAEFNDGTTKPVVVTIDPNTGESIIQ